MNPIAFMLIYAIIGALSSVHCLLEVEELWKKDKDFYLTSYKRTLPVLLFCSVALWPIYWFQSFFIWKRHSG